MKRLANALGTLVAGAFVFGAGVWLVASPDTPLPPEWNPTAPLNLSEPETLWTAMKLRRALAAPQTCLAALEGQADLTSMEPLMAEGGCGIDPRVRLSRVGGTDLAPVETTCAIALRLAAWERYTVQPAAEVLGSPVTRFRHQSSYNCRPIRGGTRLSTHATAEAIDIAGVTLADGRQLELLDHWDGPGPEAQFFHALRDGGCDWFLTVLGPDYNALHADHFHMQSVGYGLCR